METTPQDQLKELLNEYGFASRDLAQVLGMNVPTFKKYKSGTESLSEVTTQQLDKFYRMVTRLYYINLNTLGPKRFDNRSHSKTTIAGWFDKPFDLPEGYIISPWDIFKNNDLESAEKYFALIIVLQTTHQPIEEALDKALPGWRDTRSDWVVFKDVDGHNSIRLRDQ